MNQFGAGLLLVLFKNCKAKQGFDYKAELRHGIADSNAVELVRENEGEVRRGIDNAGNHLLCGVAAEFLHVFSNKKAENEGTEHHANRLGEHCGKAVGVYYAKRVVPYAEAARADGQGDKAFFKGRLACAGFVGGVGGKVAADDYAGDGGKAKYDLVCGGPLVENQNADYGVEHHFNTYGKGKCL